MTNNKQSKDYLYGVPELLILRLLADKEMYGYEIVQGIKDRSGNAMDFGEGVIYPLLHSLRKRRLLAIRREKVGGRNRIYYRLTSLGQNRLDAKTSDWEQVSAAIQKFLSGDCNAPSATP